MAVWIEVDTKGQPGELYVEGGRDGLEKLQRGDASVVWTVARDGTVPDLVGNDVGVLILREPQARILQKIPRVRLAPLAISHTRPKRAVPGPFFAISIANAPGHIERHAHVDHYARAVATWIESLVAVPTGAHEVTFRSSQWTVRSARADGADVDLAASPPPVPDLPTNYFVGWAVGNELLRLTTLASLAICVGNEEFRPKDRAEVAKRCKQDFEGRVAKARVLFGTEEGWAAFEAAVRRRRAK